MNEINNIIIIIIRNVNFGFTPGRGTADAIFAVQQRMEKHRGKQDCIFIDLEKGVR